MIVEKMEEFEKLSFSEKAAVLNRLVSYPALAMMTWTRPDLGSRLLMPGSSMGALLMFGIGIFVSDRADRFFFLFMAVMTLLSCLQLRFKRWREFHKGVRQHSYYLGTAKCRRFLPAFLCRKRRPERLLEPLVFVGFGLVASVIAPITGGWIIFSALCVTHIENLTRAREDDEQRDIVDGLIKSEIQTDTVERFEEPVPQAAQAPTNGKIATGLSPELAARLRERRKS